MGACRAGDALGFGWTLAVASVAVMGLFVNLLAAALLAFTIVLLCRHLYALAEAPHGAEHRDRRSCRRAAAGDRLGRGDRAVSRSRRSCSCLIIFLWTPPHFWALALYRSEDYARAGVPMMPVVQGKRSTRWQILLYALVLFPAGLLPGFVGPGGTALPGLRGVFGGWLVLGRIAVWRETDENRSRPRGACSAYRSFICSCSLRP